MDFKLKAKIVEKFGSQREFSRRLGVNESVVSNVVRGKALNRPDAEKWAAALGIPAENTNKIFRIWG